MMRPQCTIRQPDAGLSHDRTGPGLRQPDGTLPSSSHGYRNLQKSVLPPASRPAFRLRVRCWPVSGRCCCEGFGCIHAGAAGLPSGCRGGHMVEVTGFLWRRQCAGSEGMTAGDSRRHGQLRTASRASLDRAAKYRWASGRCSNRASRRMREMATLLRAARLRGRWRTRARQRSSS